jgi:hypothetical protein
MLKQNQNYIYKNKAPKNPKIPLAHTYPLQTLISRMKNKRHQQKTTAYTQVANMPFPCEKKTFSLLVLLKKFQFLVI